MRRIESGIGFVAALAVGISLVGCATVPKLTGSEKIAVVNYTIEKSIVKSGSAPDNGPGLLNKDKENYYVHHQEAVDQAWAAFKAKAPGIFGASRLVDFGAIEGNPEILALTASAKGPSAAAAGLFLSPAGLPYMNIYDAKLAAKIAAVSKADLLISIRSKAEFAMTTGLSVGGIGGGKAHMCLIATVDVVNASGKLLRSTQITGISKETATTVSIGMGFGMDPSNYPRLIVSAQEDLSAKLAKEFAAW